MTYQSHTTIGIIGIILYFAGKIDGARHIFCNKIITEYREYFGFEEIENFTHILVIGRHKILSVEIGNGITVFCNNVGIPFKHTTIG